MHTSDTCPIYIYIYITTLHVPPSIIQHGNFMPCTHHEMYDPIRTKHGTINGTPNHEMYDPIRTINVNNTTMETSCPAPLEPGW